MAAKRTQRTYDHRLIRLVQETRDPSIATRLGVPRSTVSGWIRRARRTVMTAPVLETTGPDLQVRVTRLEKRVQRLEALLRVLLAVLRVLQPDLARLRIPRAADKSGLLRAIDRARGVLGLRRVLRLMGISPSRLSAWRRAAEACELEDRSSCPVSTPHALTPGEVSTVRDMVTSKAFRHVPTSRLAALAQRLGCVLASTTTWCRLVRERGWRRPRLRVHPEQPRQGIRAGAPDELWHIDTTVIRLLDGTKAYAQAIVDNFSRRILAWRVTERIDAGSSVDLLVEAGAHLPHDSTPTVMADQGSENCNGAVDSLVEGGVLRRVLAQVDLVFSNSLIEAWWRSLKHNWLFLHPMDSVPKVRRLVAFYVEQHNAVVPHAAFEGQTPDEMYFGTGDAVPDRLAEVRATARAKRLEENRARRCAVCA